MDSIPMASADLIKRLDQEFPKRNARPSDFKDEESKIRFAMLSGKREMIDWLKDLLETTGYSPEQKITMKGV